MDDNQRQEHFHYWYGDELADRMMLGDPVVLKGQYKPFLRHGKFFEQWPIQMLGVCDSSLQSDDTPPKLYAPFLYLSHSFAQIFNAIDLQVWVPSHLECPVSRAVFSTENLSYESKIHFSPTLGYRDLAESYHDSPLPMAELAQSHPDFESFIETIGYLPFNATLRLRFAIDNIVHTAKSITVQELVQEKYHFMQVGDKGLRRFQIAPAESSSDVMPLTFADGDFPKPRFTSSKDLLEQAVLGITRTSRGNQFPR